MVKTWSLTVRHTEHCLLQRDRKTSHPWSLYVCIKAQGTAVPTSGTGKSSQLNVSLKKLFTVTALLFTVLDYTVMIICHVNSSEL